MGEQRGVPEPRPQALEVRGNGEVRGQLWVLPEQHKKHGQESASREARGRPAQGKQRQQLEIHRTPQGMMGKQDG